MANFHQYSKFTSEHFVSVKFNFAPDLACVSFTSITIGE